MGEAPNIPHFALRHTIKKHLSSITETNIYAAYVITPQYAVL